MEKQIKELLKYYRNEYVADKILMEQILSGDIQLSSEEADVTLGELEEEIIIYEIIIEMVLMRKLLEEFVRRKRMSKYDVAVYKFTRNWEVSYVDCVGDDGLVEEDCRLYSCGEEIDKYDSDWLFLDECSSIEDMINDGILKFVRIESRVLEERQLDKMKYIFEKKGEDNG